MTLEGYFSIDNRRRGVLPKWPQPAARPRGAAIIGAFLAVDPDPVSAAANGLAFFGLAGETAETRATGPGTFRIHLLDALSTLTPKEIARRCRISED